jgi:amino acid adenylation domain-containing protein
MLLWQNAPEEDFELPGLSVAQIDPESHVVSKFDLTMILQEAGNRIAGALEYDTALFEESTINRYLGYFRTVLEGMAAGGDHQFVDRLPMLGEEERKQVLYEWNQPQRDYPRDQCVHELFEEQVGRSPNAIAVQYEDVSLSYIELNRQANQLGHYLRKLGVGPEVRVGICLERSLDMVVAVMGVLKAGGAYVPLDPGYPHERLQFMVEDSHPAVLISQRSLKQRLSLDQAGLLCLEDIREEISHCSCEKLESGVAADNLAYLIYTSGSTGRPKGTMVTHGNVMRLLRATEPWFGFDAQDVWTMFHSYAFDFSVWELWGALAYGGRLVVVPYWVSRSPGAFYTLVKQCGVTILNQTPSAFQQFSREDEGRQEELKLRLVIFGGEALEMSSLLPWMERHGDETPRMVNMYGITETTVHVTYQVLAKDLARGKASVIGERIPDLQLYILRDMEPVPVGAAGEIYVGGAGLARGYWKRAGLTAERFMPNPFSEREGARLYKTGDLGRYRQDGNIEYLGRIDQQVKIRGFRIELGEIEAQLAQCGGVAESVVVASEHVPGERRLVAYYTLEKGIAEQDVPDAQALREHLSQTLPDYMVPAEFVRLERLPLTENRKLDRKALPPPESNRRTERGYEAPLGDLETAIARIWADVLQVERISRDDNFFKLGGHSLSAVRLAGRIKQELETDVTVRHLFEFPSVAALAKQLQENATRNDPSLESIVPVLRTDAVPLSYGQHQLWVVQQFNPGSTAYHIPSLFHLHGNLNTEILERSFSEIVRRHEILRTSFPTRQRHPVQRIEAPRRLLFPLVDLATLPADERSLAFDRLIDEDCKQPFSLASGPLIRFLLVRLSDQHHALLITLHHIVADAWSIPILVRELTAIYSALLKGKQNPLVDLPIQYADYALWLSGQTRSAAFARSLQYWRDQLAGAPVLKLPCEDAGDEEQAEGAVREISIPADVLQRLHELGEREGYTLFMTLLACWQILLARYCDETDIVIGAPVANRPTPDLYGLIGYFVNTVALRTDLSGDPSFHEVMQRSRTVVLDAHTHQQIPFEYLVAELKPPRDPGQAPFFRAVFTFLNFESVPYALPQLRIESQAVRKFTAKFDLELSATEHDGRVDLSFIYKRQIFREELVERMLNDYLALLRGLVETPSSSIWNVDLCEPAVQSSLPQTKRSSIQQQPETPVALAPAPAAADGRIENKSEGIEGKIAATLLDIPLEGEQRMEQFVAEYNRTEAAYESRCFHELFEAQVTSRPQGTAVIFGDERVTYQELNERANQLAHYLREQGVGPEKWVGLCLDRSIEMVVAMLGVMKAGGGYVPLDPGYPKQRLAYMLSDSAPALVVGMGRQLDFGEMFDLGERQNILQNYATVNPEGIADLQNPVALIYTSGSTGVPKGVTISHAALTNHMQWMSRTFGISSKDRILQKAPISFDASITELCLPLMTGGILVLAKPGGQQDSGYLVDLIIEQEITVAQFVPSLMEFMVRERNFTQCTTLKWLLSGAEPLPRTLATKVHDMLGLDIMNLYGPTEVTIDAIFCQVTPEHERVMVGKPIGNMRAYVLNENGQPAPVGEVGEIYIGGVQLARGYWARPELTAERFIPDAVSGTPGERLYRTGDLGRWGTDGELECLGRCDDQIKIRGCRVERGEIETRLRAYPGVTQTAIRLWRDAEGQNHLIAYLVGASRDLTSRQVRRDLADSLPEYMLPTHVIFLEVAPLTPSGKLDARSLPLPQVSSAAEENVARSDRSTESIVLSIWRQILATEEFGLDDNFFDIGGNSFLLLEVRQKLCAQLGINISVPDMLRFATVRSLSESLKPELQTYSSSQ